jgi:maltooligosyltrehalose synthase
LTRTQTFQKIYIIPNNNFCEVSQTSKYTGVSWHKDNKKWQAQLKHNKKSYYGRYFDNEEHAAMTVNLLCDKYEIARKNPMINIKADVIQQVIPLFSTKYGKVK